MEKEMFIHALIFCISILVIMRSFKRTDPKYSYNPDYTAGDLLCRYKGYPDAMAVQPAMQLDSVSVVQEEAVAFAETVGSTEDRAAVALSPVRAPFNKLSIHFSQVLGGHNLSVGCACLGDRSPPKKLLLACQVFLNSMHDVKPIMIIIKINNIKGNMTQYFT